MKLSATFFFSLLFSGASYGQTRFNYRIYIPDTLDKTVLEVINDAKYWLDRMTGRQYAISKSKYGNEPGIQIQWASEASLSKEKIKLLESNGQSFYLVVNGQVNAQIVGTGKNSFINGIYTFLHEIGFRWYMPGDNWTIIPTDIKKDLKINKVYTPAFLSRSYFGTGGVNAIEKTDPQNTFRADYDLWNRRNRFSSDYVQKGHAGHLFYNAQRKELDKNPALFCNGKINPYGRIDISQPQVVKLFVDWALGQIKVGDPYPVIGVDPSDGSGGKDDCIPVNIPGIKTWSDKYFWLANRVAESISNKNSKAIVQLYAYDTHSDTPGFELNPRVYPIIIPYAFQNVTTPDEFIKIWSRKVKGRAIGMYDYWNITQWSVGLPQFNIYSIPEKLRLWKRYNVTSVNLESTNAKGPMGHALWLASQMMWNTDISFDSLYNEFLQSCFGPAVDDIKRMYDRWSLRYQEAMEVSLSLQDLEMASRKTKDPKIKARISELKAYVHYLKLYYDYKFEPTNIKYKEIIDYIQLIHPLRLTQTSALLLYYIKKPKDYKELKLPGSASVKKDNKEELFAIIEKNFQTDFKGAPQAYRVSNLNFDITKVRLVKSDKVSNPRFINGPVRYNFYLEKNSFFEIQMGSTASTKVRIIDRAEKIWLEKTISSSKEGYERIKVSLPKGQYSILYGEFARFSRIIFPVGMVFISSGVNYYDNAGFPLQHVYVPNDVNAIIYEDQYGPGTNKRGFWVNPDGKRVDPVKIKNGVYKIEVPDKYKGKVWVLNIGHRAFKILNIPNYYSLQQFEYEEK